MARTTTEELSDYEKRIRSTALRAKDNLKKFGWVRHHMGSDAYGYCLLGVINASTKNEETKRIVQARLKNLIGGKNVGHTSISTWNDRNAQGVGDVYKILTSVARGYGRRR